MKILLGGNERCEKALGGHGAEVRYKSKEALQYRLKLDEEVHLYWIKKCKTVLAGSLRVIILDWKHDKKINKFTQIGNKWKF